MTTFMILVTIVAYCAAVFMLVRYRSYRYLVALLAGHFVVLLDPLWQRLYGLSYPAGSGISLWNRTVPMFMVLSYSWMAILPALLLYFGHKQRWWRRDYITGLIAFCALVLYHMILQGIGSRAGLWTFANTSSVFGMNPYMLLAIMGGLVSLLILYVLVMTRFYAPETAIPTIVIGVVLAYALVYGILGAPFWMPRLIEGSETFAKIGVLVTLFLTGWVVHLACLGIHNTRKQMVITG